MKTFVAIFAALALANLSEALFIPAIVGAGSVAGPSIVLGAAGSTSLLPLATTIVGGALTLKAVGILVASGALGSAGIKVKRSAEEINQEDLAFSFLAQNEPQACYRRLICDLATGTQPKSENDVILASFVGETPATSAKYDFAVAAEVGKALKSVQSCELRYSCPLSGKQIAKLFN